MFAVDFMSGYFYAYKYLFAPSQYDKNKQNVMTKVFFDPSTIQQKRAVQTALDK